MWFLFWFTGHVLVTLWHKFVDLRREFEFDVVLGRWRCDHVLNDVFTRMSHGLMFSQNSVSNCFMCFGGDTCLVSVHVWLSTSLAGVGTAVDVCCSVCAHSVVWGCTGGLCMDYLVGLGAKVVVFTVVWWSLKSFNSEGKWWNFDGFWCVIIYLSMSDV